MEKTITKNLMCIVLRGGIEIWVEEEKIKILQKILTVGQGSKFIELEGEVINTVDITGIFKAHTMEGVTRRRNGEFQHKGEWLPRGTTICKCGNVLSYGKQCGLCG